METEKHSVCDKLQISLLESNNLSEIHYGQLLMLATKFNWYKVCVKNQAKITLNKTNKQETLNV